MTEFAALVFSRPRPENFQNILEFKPIPRLSKDNRQHMFLTGLIFHALDQAQTYSDLLPSSLLDAEFDLQNVIRHLSIYLASISFSSAYVHASMCYLSNDFTAAVRQNFLGQHPIFLNQVNRWLDNIIGIQQKQSKLEQRRQFKENMLQKGSPRQSEKVPQQKRNMAKASAKRQVILDNAGPSTLADLALVTVTNSNWFFNSHEDPTKALLLFAYNSGHS